MFNNPFKRSRKSDDDIGSTSYNADSIRSLQEKIDKLNSEKKILIQTNEKNMRELRETYEDQIERLRSNLKEAISVKSKIELEKTELESEFDRCNSIKDKMSDSIINLQRRCHILEDEKNNKDLENKRLQEITQKTNLIERNLQDERKHNSELQNKVKSLEDELLFTKRLNSNLNKSGETLSVLTANHESEIQDIRKNHEKEKEKLLCEFETQFKTIENRLKSTTEELNNTKMRYEKEIGEYNENIRKLKQENSYFTSNLRENEVIMNRLREDLSNYHKELNQLRLEKENKEKSLNDEIEILKYQLNLNAKEVSKLVKEKEELEFKSNDFHDEKVGRKRRRVTDDNDPIQIDAFTNGNIRLGCRKHNDKICLWLDNVCDKDVDLNEWRLVFSGGLIKEELEYAFAPRTLNKSSILCIWNQNDGIEEDENNLTMNINVPQDKSLKCQLLNDMYEIEASLKTKERYSSTSRQSDTCSFM